MDLQVAPRTVQQETVQKLRTAILAGMFQPGDRLVEAELCKMLGVSRPSVREALRSLEAERLIAIVPNRGPQIPVMPWAEAEQIYHVRALLEGEAAALSARCATPEDLKEMEAALAAFARAVRAGHGAARIETTARFYAAILRSCGNRIIEEMIQGLQARINFLRARSMSSPGRARFSLAEMRAIHAAIERHDADAARRAAIEHVRQAQRAAAEAICPGNARTTG
jgi:DNA-binding GntR family transcriptional regulator